MIQQNKIFIVQNLTEKIKDAKAAYLVNYRGLDVAQLTDLRKAIKKAGGQLEVIKNRLFKLALQKSEKIEKEEFELTGPTAVLWATEDQITPLKALFEFIKEHDLPKVKVGIFNEELIPEEKITKLARIPTLNELQIKLVRQLSAPLYGLVSALNWNRQKLVCVLKNIADR